MSDVRLTSEYRRESISLGCVVVSAVFFVVLFQAPILKVPEIVTQVFRPAIVAVLLLRMAQRGSINFSARNVALLAALYCCFELLLNQINADEIMRALAIIMYLLMFNTVVGTTWNKREVRFIIMACFLGAFACAVAIFMSNNPTDFNVGSGGDMKMFGMYVNRNKNAYAFSIGTIIGVIYLLYGKNIKKFWIAMLTAVIVYALLYSQCRGAFFCAVAGVIISVAGVLLKIKKKSEMKFLLYSILTILFCIAAYYILKNSELSRLIDGESKSGRDDGIKYAWHLYLNCDLFGKIFGNGHGYEAAHTEGVGAHLVYITYLLSTGIIGCSLIVLMLLKSLFRVKGAVPYALFTCAFLRTFFEGLDYYIYIPLMLSLIIYNYNNMYGRNTYELFSERQI